MISGLEYVGKLGKKEVWNNGAVLIEYYPELTRIYDYRNGAGFYYPHENHYKDFMTARDEALSKMPKTIQFKSHIGLDFDPPVILLKLPINVDLDEFCMNDLKVTFEIIEEVQE